MKVLESALYVGDLDTAKVFYTALLGIEPYRFESGRHCFFRLDGHMLLLFVAEATSVPNKDLPIPTHGAKGPGHLCFASEPKGMLYWERKLAELDIQIERDFTWPNGARSLYFPDPSGNSLEIAEPRLWEF